MSVISKHLERKRIFISSNNNFLLKDILDGILAHMFDNITNRILRVEGN